MCPTRNTQGYSPALHSDGKIKNYFLTNKEKEGEKDVGSIPITYLYQSGKILPSQKKVLIIVATAS